MTHRALVVLLGMACAARVAAAQESFTKQVILVYSFGGVDRKLADAVGDAIRSRVARSFRSNEASVVSEREVDRLLIRSGIERASSDTIHLRALARAVRADEVIQGEVERLSRTRVRATARLVLARDRRMLQPLGTVEGSDGEAVGRQLAETIVAMRRQMVPLRRCENTAREGDYARAVEEAERGAAAVPGGVLVRTCLMNAMLAQGAPAPALLAQAREIFKVHEGAWWAIDGSARAFDALGQRDSAAAYWLRLADTDTTDLALGRRITTALLQGGNARHAVPLVERLLRQAPEDLPVRRLHWQSLAATSAWSAAVTVGAALYADDVESHEDSSFVWRYALARRAAGDTIRAMAIAADGVVRFPRDSRLYLLYADLVRTDGRVAVSRGVERFPELAELRLLRAQELRTAGKQEEAIEALRVATTLDSASGQGHLALAQAWADVGQLDSALVEAHRAMGAQAERGVVAQFVLARGNAIYRAASATKQRSDYERALSYLAFADSLESSLQSQFLLGATALAISQRAATEAPEAKSCELSRRASEMMPLAREKITRGARVAPDASRQYLDYLDALEPVVTKQLEVLCAPPGATAHPGG